MGRSSGLDRRTSDAGEQSQIEMRVLRMTTARTGTWIAGTWSTGTWITGTWATALLLAAALGTSTPAASAAEPNCRAIESTSARLSCYDAAFPPRTAKPAESSNGSSSGYKDPFLAEEARTAAKLKNICRGC